MIGNTRSRTSKYTFPKSYWSIMSKHEGMSNHKMPERILTSLRQFRLRASFVIRISRSIRAAILSLTPSPVVPLFTVIVVVPLDDSSLALKLFAPLPVL